MHAVRCNLNTAYYTLHTVYCTLHTAHCILHTEYCTLHTAHCTLHTQVKLPPTLAVQHRSAGDCPDKF